jgi:predicted regulator of Ras-like GTPase activity (Roadblock/LC7/MglB family)
MDKITMLDNLEKDIIKLMEEEISKHNALIGINIGTLDGALIANQLKKEFKLTKYQIASANSSILFLSSKMLSDSLNQTISHNIITGKDIYLLSILTTNITMIAYLDRELTDLEGMYHYTRILKDFALKISAIIETSTIAKEEIFVLIKRAIPNTLILAILTKDGLPIKIQSTMREPMLSAVTSAIYNLSEVLSEGKNVEYLIITGENGSIIIHELDETRILAVAVPEAEESKIGAYIAKIKSIISAENY